MKAMTIWRAFVANEAAAAAFLRQAREHPNSRTVGEWDRQMRRMRQDGAFRNRLSRICRQWDVAREYLIVGTGELEAIERLEPVTP